MEDPEQKNLKPKPKAADMITFGLLGQVGVEFAVMIAAPLLIFIFLGPILRLVGLDSLGEWVDNGHKDSKMFKLVGLLFAIFISGFLIYRRTYRLKQMISDERKNP